MEPADPPDDVERPANTGRIVGAGSALLLVVLAALMLNESPIEDLDPTQSLGRHVTLGELPFGFRIADAYALTGGEDFVLLDRDDARETRTEAVEEVARLDEEEGADESTGEDEESSLPETAAERERNALEDGTPPSLVYVVRYPVANSLRVLRRHLARKVEDPEKGTMGSELELTVDGGRLPWGDYEADFVHQRKYEEGGHFTDEVRVNLTLGDECWILFALWPRDYRGSTTPVEALLAAMPPLEAD